MDICFTPLRGTVVTLMLDWVFFFFCRRIQYTYGSGAVHHFEPLIHLYDRYSYCSVANGNDNGEIQKRKPETPRASHSRSHCRHCFHMIEATVYATIVLVETRARVTCQTLMPLSNSTYPGAKRTASDSTRPPLCISIAFISPAPRSSYKLPHFVPLAI